MRLFRDEEHVHRAYDEPGAIFSPAQLWQLAQRWYGDRLQRLKHVTDRVLDAGVGIEDDVPAGS